MLVYNNKKIDNFYSTLCTLLELIPTVIFCVLLWAGSAYHSVGLDFCAIIVFAVYVFDSFLFRTCYIICWLDELSQAVTNKIFYKDLKIAELTNRIEMQHKQIEELASEHEQLLIQYNKNATKLKQMRKAVKTRMKECRSDNTKE